ncbi:Hsp70 protein-domain-containing protein [Flagelloscypha sp. PMI_526]|nr:Hsp70 protein-domain-containing protein [Flagelloscypha sp. PMI_526]
MHFLILWNLLLCLAALPEALASVLAIDFGQDWIKASLMKPGVPFDVLLNKDSKRKIQASVGWKQSDRLFGTDAFNLASRFPSDSFSQVKFLQATPYESDDLSYYSSISTADLVKTERNTVGFKTSSGSEWSAEELVAMHSKETAVADAVEIGGLRLLALINDGTAVAVNYAMTRTFNTPETHVIYDAGASSIRATVVQFATSKDKKDDKATSITVLGVGYDQTVGGVELDRRLRDMLVDNFNAKHKRTFLWKEAGRVKAILSANSEAFATCEYKLSYFVESLAWDIDFKSKVTRTALESACADLRPRYAQPILDALHNAGLGLENVTSVILTGGHSRTPMVQSAVKAAVGEDKIALNVNADEAVVLGAALHGAGLSRQFKTKNIKVQDISLHDVQASSISTVIFPAGSRTGTKKTMTFKRTDDFKIFLDYKTEPARGIPTRLLESEIIGVTEAVKNLTEAGATDITVKATLSLSESGFVSIKDAVAHGEIKDESLTGKLKGLFGGASSESGEETESTDASSDASTPSEAATNESAKEKSAPATKPKDTYKLDVANEFGFLGPMTLEQKQAARARLRDIDLTEAAKTRKEEARNSLESYLYRLRDLLDDDNKDTPFKKCSQESERRSILEKLDSTFEWLHDKGDYAETSELLDKRNDLESFERPIVHRYKEIEAFPSTLNSSQMWNWHTHLFLTEARENITKEAEAGLPSKWTSAELDTLEKTLKDHEKWLDVWVEKQKSVKMNEDPVIETTEMKARAKVLETALQKLWKRKQPKAPKKTTTKEEGPTEETQTTEPPQPEGEQQQVPVEHPPTKNHVPDEL